MASSLAEQLKLVASAAPTEERLKGKASLLYDIREAADIDLETIYAVGLQGFAELSRLDARFEAAGKSLFSKQASETNRELQDRDANAKIDAAIEGFLRLLTGYFLDENATKCLEYLVRRYKVHVRNVDALIACALPYHCTPEFVKLVQLCALEGTSFYFLAKVKELGAAPPRSQLVQRCTHDGAFLSFICDAAATTASNKGVPGAASAFYAVTLTESIAAMKQVTAATVPRLLPYLEAGLAPGASSEQFAGAIIVSVQLALKAQLAQPLTEALMEGLAKGARAPLHAQVLQALLVLCQTQRVRALPSRAFKHLVKLPDLASHVADMAKKYVCDELLCVLVVALAGAVTAHANYERVLTEVIVDVELSDVAVLALVRELAVTGTKDAAVGADANGAGGARDNTAEREAAARALRLCDAHHPIACSAAVDKVLAEAARRAVVASDGVEVAGDAAGSGKTKRAKDDAAKPKPAESPFAAFLRWALSGSAAGPMPGHAASLGAALDHPQPGLREAALKELKRGGSSAKTMSSGTVLAGALLRRVSDDKPRVAAAAAGLPGVRVAIGDDDALFDAASERLNVAAAKCAGKTPEAELERAVAKRCVKLLVGVLSTPPRRPGAAGGEGAEKSAEKGAEESDAEESDSEESDSEASVEAAADGAAGPLAGRAAATAFAHVLFSPSTRAVARAALDAAARNPHPLLWKFREKAFQKAVAEAQSIGGAPTPDAKASKRKSLKKEKEVEAKDVDAAAQKEARARSDAAVNALVITALAEGLSAWNDVDAMTLWVKETWRDGTNRARGTLLLSLREACGRASAAAARAATWTVAKDAWNDEDVGASVLGERKDEEDAKRGDAPLSKHTARALSKNGDAAAAVLPALTRRALLAMLDATCARKGNDHGNGRERRVLKEVFLAMAAADDESGEGRFKTHFDALLRASERSGVSSTTFLAARASENPEGGGGGGGGGGETSTGSIAAGPQVALTLLKNADAKDADASRSGSLLATLIVACAATEPRVRAAAAAAIAALAPGKKSVKKSSPSAGVVALWSSLKDAAGDIGSVAKSVDAREVLVDAIARGLDVKQTGSSESTNDAIGEILAPVAAIGGGGKAKESYILARLHDDDDDDDGSSEVRVDAYGARVLVAVLAGVGDDAVKAAALAPALRRCLLLGGGDGGGDLAALAVNLLEVYTPAFAKAAKNTRDASWTAYADALRPPSPAPARVAAMCVATPAFVDALPAAARGECLGALFAAVGGDPDAGARAAARDAVDALKVSAADVIEMLQTATAAAKALVSGGGGGGGDDGEGKKSKRAKGAARASGDAPAASASDAVSAAIAALEVVAWKSPKDIERRGDIAGPCMDLLSALLDAAAFAKRTPAAAANDDGDDDDDDTARPAKGIAAGEASGGYAQALVMSTLETLANEQRVGRGGDAAETSSTTAWSYALVVRAVRDAEPGPAREAALSLLAAVARSDPAGAVDHVLEVSSALTHGATDKGSDDPLARRALERALAAVVPAWIAGGHGVAAAAAKVVDALPDAPAHRRGPLCGALLRACPPGEGLPRVLLLMLGNMKTLEEAATKAAEKRAKRARKSAEKAGGRVAAAFQAEREDGHAGDAGSGSRGKWVMDLAASLLARESASGSVDALVEAMKGAIEDGGRLVWLSAEVAAKHLSSRAFLAAARKEATAALAAADAAATAAGEAEANDDAKALEAATEAEERAVEMSARLREGYADLAACALTLLQAGAAGGSEKNDVKSPSSSGKKKSSATPPDADAAPILVAKDAKAASKMERGGRQVLAALDGLLAPGPYLRALAPLLDHDDGSVRRKALRLVAHRLRAAAAASAAAASTANKHGKRAGKERARDARSRARAKDRAWLKKSENHAASAERKAEDEEEEEEEWTEEVDAGVAIIARVAELADSGGAATRHAALSALEAAAARFADADAAADSLLAAVPSAVAGMKASSRGVVASAATCFAALIRALGVRSLPILNESVPALFEAATDAAGKVNAKAAKLKKKTKEKKKDDDDDESDDDDDAKVLVAALNAVDVLMETMGGYLSPHLPSLLSLLFAPAVTPAAGSGVEARDAQIAAAKSGSAAAIASEVAASLRASLPRAAPLRLLLKPISDAYDAAVALGGGAGAGAASAALRVVAAAATASPPTQNQRVALLATLLRALDVRRSPPKACDADDVDAVEGAAVDAFVSVSMQLTESAFVPAFAHVVEWAKARASDAPAARARLAALFRLSASLADALRAVFTPLATPLLDLAAAALDPASDPAVPGGGGGSRKKKKRKSEGGGDGDARANEDAGDDDPAVLVAEMDTWRMRTRALGALRRLFAHDKDGGDFLDAARFNQLHPLITRQLSSTPPRGTAEASAVREDGEGEDDVAASASAVVAEGSLGAEVVKCVAAMVAAAPDDALWKPAHRGVLLATRDGKTRARLLALAALGAIVDALEEEYLALLPEAIPFLSELFEDPDERVEAAARKLTARLTELSGEDLKSLMSEGGGR